MTIAELIQLLQDAADEFGEEVEVRLAHQPNYPLEYGIGEVVVVEGEGDEEDDAADGAIVYIGEGGQLGYLSGHASRELGWRS